MEGIAYVHTRRPPRTHTNSTHLALCTQTLLRVDLEDQVRIGAREVAEVHTSLLDV
jgi:hypothetical protein